MIDRTLSIAPMMDCTDRHYRYFLRLALAHTLLYTEMVPAMALQHGNHEKFLGFNSKEKPLALQLGGCDPQALAYAASLGQNWGYDEINLNIGCPSERVQSGRFGVALMKEPELVAECVSAMQEAVNLPVTVKCRVGVDDYDSDRWLDHFIDTVQKAGCQTFIVHARKAWLKGLNPRQNRNIPPLNHDRVFRLKRRFPHLEIIINGGIVSFDDTHKALQKIDGVMMGRPAYSDPMYMQNLESSIYQKQAQMLTEQQWLAAYIPYVERAYADRHVSIQRIIQHLLGLFQNFKGAKAWRRYLTESARQHEQGIVALKEAVDHAFIQDNAFQETSIKNAL